MEDQSVIFHRNMFRKTKNLVKLKMSTGILLALAIGLVPQLSPSF